MEEKLGQSTAVLFKYEKLILAEEETTSAGGCGVSLAAFSRPASACPSDRVDLLTKWFSKKSVLKKVQEKVISAIKTAKTG